MSLPPRRDGELIHLVAECEATRQRLLAAIGFKGATPRSIETFVDARVAALQALAEHLKIVPASDFVTKTNNPAA